MELENKKMHFRRKCIFTKNIFGESYDENVILFRFVFVLFVSFCLFLQHFFCLMHTHPTDIPEKMANQSKPVKLVNLVSQEGDAYEVDFDICKVSELINTSFPEGTSFTSFF
jgi:hypothetical protein